MSSKVRTVKRQSDWSSPVQAEPERFSGITTKRYYLVKWIAMITMLILHVGRHDADFFLWKEYRV